MPLLGSGYHTAQDDHNDADTEYYIQHCVTVRIGLCSYYMKRVN